MEPINIEGIYKKNNSSTKLELDAKGLYTLYNPKSLDHFVIEQCNYASKGQWRYINDNNAIDLISENYYQRQKGFEFEIKSENKHSNDSIYINIQLSKDFNDVIPTPIFNVLINSNTSNLIETSSQNIKISKKVLANNFKNTINFDILFKVYGNIFYNNRLRYRILENYTLDISKANYFTISLPYFDQCFYEFEPYYHDYILIKDKKTLMWKGVEWIKQ